MIYKFTLQFTFKVAHIKIATVWPSFLFVLVALFDTYRCALQVLQTPTLCYKQLIDCQFSMMRISASPKWQ